MPGAEGDVALLVELDVGGVVLEEDGLGAAVEVDEVEDDGESELVCGADEGLEVVLGAVFGVDGEVVGDAVGVLGVVEAGAVLAVGPVGGVGVVVGGVDGAEVDDVDADLGEVREELGGVVEGAARGERAEEELVDDGGVEEGRGNAGGHVGHAGQSFW